MIFEDQPDGGVRRIGGVKLLEEGDELARAVSIFDAARRRPVRRAIPANRLSVPCRLYCKRPVSRA
jgi:CRISPR/Cas system Type II protein with McrA/HNH and RuvC-like nuclease domain